MGKKKKWKSQKFAPGDDDKLVSGSSSKLHLWKQKPTSLIVRQDQFA